MKKHFNYFLLFLIVFLVGFSFLFFACLSAPASLQRFGNTNYYLFHQDSTKYWYNCGNKAYVMIDLVQEYSVDSIRLYLFQTGLGADTINWFPWKQTFGMYVSNDMIKWDSIGGGVKVNQIHW